MMDIFDISASALTAQRMRLDVIASNLANANTTRQKDGSIGAYKRHNVVFEPVMTDAVNALNGNSDLGNHSNFANHIGLKTSSLMGTNRYGQSALGYSSGGGTTLKASITKTNSLVGMGVKVGQIVQDLKSPDRMEYNPGHPDADENGFVHMPNINVVSEMVDMIAASRSYEANVNAIQAGKGMIQAALNI